MLIYRFSIKAAFGSRTARYGLLFAATACSAVAMAAAVRFDFAAHGSFKRMSHTGDTSAQVELSALPQRAGTWGVGALADLKGEVVLIDGRLLVSRGDAHQGRVSAPQPGDAAVLMAVAQVQEWADVPVPRDLTQAQFEAFVAEQAAARGLDRTVAFPFTVQGRFPALTWHVVTGKSAGGHGSGHGGGHANPHAGMKVFEQPGAAGRLVGVVSGDALEGVVSHPGERLHLHFVDEALTVSGHVDAYSVAAGSTLRLPLR